MSLRRRSSLLKFAPAALLASEIGVWETDYAAGRMSADATVAGLFGVGRAAAARGLPLEVYARKVHPEDRVAVFDKLDEVRATGGIFVIEYRTCPDPGEVRWVLVRGRYERDPDTGTMIGRGIIIDITDHRIYEQVRDRAVFVRSLAEDSSNERIADLVLEARRLLDERGEAKTSPMRKAVDELLLVTGRALAADSIASQKRDRSLH